MFRGGRRHTNTHVLARRDSLAGAGSGGTGAGASHTNDEAKSTGPSGEGRQLGSSCAGVVLAWRRKHKTITYSLKEKKKMEKQALGKQIGTFCICMGTGPNFLRAQNKARGAALF